MTVFAPAIITGIKKGAKWGLAVFSMTFMWLILLLGVVGFYYFFLTSNVNKGYVDLPMPSEIQIPVGKMLPDVEPIPLPSTESL